MTHTTDTDVHIGHLIRYPWDRIALCGADLTVVKYEHVAEHRSGAIIAQPYPCAVQSLCSRCELEVSR